MRTGPPLLYLTTAAGLALTARAALGPPPPMAASLGCLAGYLGLVALGVARPGLAMWAEVVNRVEGARGVALTFDADDLGRARSIARRLGRARGTFFVAGEACQAQPDLARALADAGHEIATCGMRRDPWLFARPAARISDDVARSLDAAERASGQRPASLRPHRGRTSPRVARAAADLDLDLVGWALSAPGGAAAALASRVEGGDVLALGCDEATEAALPALLSAIDDRNLHTNTVGELLTGP